MRTAVGLAAVAALVVSTAPAHAGAKPQIQDATGDYPVAAADIVSGALALTGKKKKTLTIRLTLAGAPATTTPYAYSVNFKVADCDFSAVYYGHPFTGVFSNSGVGCQDGSTSLPEGEVVVEGSTIVWNVPLGDGLKAKNKITALTAQTEPTGMFTGLAAQSGDSATGSDWVIG